MTVMNSFDLMEPEADTFQEFDESDNSDEIKTKKLFVPKVQNMDNYLLKHYKSRILQDLNEQLVNNRIQELICKPVKSERITSSECVFRHFNYWRINQTDLWIQIDLRLELRVDTSDGVDTDFYWFSVQLWFSFACDEEEYTGYFDMPKSKDAFPHDICVISSCVSGFLMESVTLTTGSLPSYSSPVI